MADEKIVFKVVVDDKGNVVKLQSTEKGFNDIDLTVKNAEKSAQKLNQTIGKTGSGGTLKSLKLTQKEYGKLAKTQHQVSDATGSATSATMELSRVISDAPYGIRGMANNITQLVSQLGTASTKAGGLGGALKLMGKQLTGPLGIVFAITAAVSALDFFFGANQKSKKAVSDLTKEVYSSGLVANQYVKELEDVNLTEKRRKVVTQELIKLVPTLKKEDLKYGKNLDNVKLKIKQYTLAQASRIEMDKLVEQNSALLSKQMRVDLVNSTEDQEEKVRIIKGLLKEEGIELEKAVNKSYQMGQSNLTLRKKTNSELIQDFKDLAKGIEKESKPILEQIDRLTQGLALDPSKNGDDKGNGKIKLLDIEDFEKQTEDYLDKIASVSQKQELLNAELNSDKVKIQERYHLEALEAKNIENKAKFKQQADAYRLEYQAFLDQQVRTTPMTKSEAKGLLNDFDEDIKAQQKASEDNFNVLIKKTKDFYFDKFFIALQGEQKIQKSKSESQTKELEDLAFYLEKYTELMGGIGDFLQAESDRELAIEQNKTNVLNKELNDRLINENLSESQRKSIQDQILKNDEALRVKQEVIKKKAFNTQKAFNISAALVDTYAAASSAYRNTLASPANILDPTVGLIRAKVNAGIAMAGGLLQVAAIARQKYQSSSAATPINTGGGGGGSATERAEPSFNIVGGSRENQLLTAIQSQFDKPLKAYVVSTEVTDQQELDGIIVNQAGL